MHDTDKQPISDLPTLLRGLDPALLPGEYVFCSVSPEDAASVLRRRPLATFREQEALSVIIDRADADALGLAHDSLHRCITLRVASSLTAVGLTATVSRALADAGLSANVVAAHHHDHVFVPAAAAGEALEVLRSLARVTEG